MSQVNAPIHSHSCLSSGRCSLFTVHLLPILILAILRHVGNLESTELCGSFGARRLPLDQGWDEGTCSSLTNIKTFSGNGLDGCIFPDLLNTKFHLEC